MLNATSSKPGFFQKLLAALLGIALLVLGFMFSLVILSIVAVLIVIGGIYFFWKTRALRKAMREAAADSSVIEGEAFTVHDKPDSRSPPLLIEVSPEKPATPDKSIH